MAAMMQKQQGLPSGYTQLEYIENITRGFIIDDILIKDTQWELVLESTSSSTQVVSGYYAAYGSHVAALSTTRYSLQGNTAGYYIDVPAGVSSTLEIGWLNNSTLSLTIGSDTVTYSVSSFSANQKTQMLALNRTSYVFKGKVYSIRCTSGGSFDGIPVQRDSDSVQGIYDLANGVFYELT